MFTVLKSLFLDLRRVPQVLAAADSDVTTLPLLHGSPLIGDYNFRVDRFDCGTDPHGFYEEDL